MLHTQVWSGIPALYSLLSARQRANNKERILNTKHEKNSSETRNKSKPSLVAFAVTRKKLQIIQ